MYSEETRVAAAMVEALPILVLAMTYLFRRGSTIQSIRPCDHNHVKTLHFSIVPQS